MYINHPEKLAWVLSLHFQNWFSKPSHHQRPITEADGDWIKLVTDKQTFQAATNHLGIPDQYIELIWEALQTVPHMSVIVKELQKAMEAPPTKEAFRWALHDQKKTTTPGMSNISYGNIKDWPEELITHCYQLLSVMWRQEHIPQA